MPMGANTTGMKNERAMEKKTACGARGKKRKKRKTKMEKVSRSKPVKKSLRRVLLVELDRLDAIHHGEGLLDTVRQMASVQCQADFQSIIHLPHTFRRHGTEFLYETMSL